MSQRTDEAPILDQESVETTDVTDLVTKLKPLESQLRDLEAFNRELVTENARLHTDNRQLTLCLKLAGETIRGGDDRSLARLAYGSLRRDDGGLRRAEHELQEARDATSRLGDELNAARAEIDRLRALCRQLDEGKLKLERELDRQTDRVRLLEEKQHRNDLTHIECKLLRLKLKELENERDKLTVDIENERRLMAQSQKNGTTSAKKIEEHLRGLMKWLDSRRGREDVLVEQIAKLEAKQKDLVEGFRMEREVFQKVIHTKTVE